MKKNKARYNSGLTLMEMMISTSLLAIFSIFIVNLVVITQKAWTIEHTAMPVRSEAKKTLEVITKELREGKLGSVVTGGGGASITFNVPNQVSQTGILSWRQVQFVHDAGQQYVTCTGCTSDGATIIIGRTINSLQFQCFDQNGNSVTCSSGNVNLVKTTIGATKTTPEGTNLQTTLSSQIRLRN